MEPLPTFMSQFIPNATTSETSSLCCLLQTLQFRHCTWFNLTPYCNRHLFIKMTIRPSDDQAFVYQNDDQTIRRSDICLSKRRSDHQTIRHLFIKTTIRPSDDQIFVYQNDDQTIRRSGICLSKRRSDHQTIRYFFIKTTIRPSDDQTFVYQNDDQTIRRSDAACRPSDTLFFCFRYKMLSLCTLLSARISLFLSFFPPFVSYLVSLSLSLQAWESWNSHFINKYTVFIIESRTLQ
jgi:hypothetical protein